MMMYLMTTKGERAREREREREREKEEKEGGRRREEAGAEKRRDGERCFPEFPASRRPINDIMHLGQR